MSSYVQYTGNGSTQTFSVTFPYLSRLHVRVSVSGIVKLSPADYEWLTDASIKFRVAPTGTIEIRRITERATALVSFTNGSVLTQEELNTAHLQNFYITQELQDALDGYITGGVARYTLGSTLGSTVQDRIDTAAADILASTLAADLQSRITDIATNAQSIISTNTTVANLQTQITNLDATNGGTATLITNEEAARIAGDTAMVNTVALIGAKSGDNTAFVANLNTLKVSPTESFASRFTALASTDSANNAAIVSEQTTRANADSALSSNISALSATVTGNNSTLTTRISNEETARASGDAAEASARTTLAARVTTAEGNIVTANAAIATEQSVRASADTANANAITTLQTTVGSHTTSISTQATSIDGIQAKYTVKIDNNGYMSGYGLISTANNGVPTSEFIVLADKFAVVTPGAAPKVPFLVSGGVCYMQNVVIQDALIANLTVGKLTTGSLVAQVTQNADWFVGTGRIIWDNGIYLKASGTGFGSSNQFIEWYGPRPAGGNLALCTEANAVSYLKTNGSAYFGGTLSAGVLRNAATGSATASNAEVVLGPFGTNGGSKTVACSYSIYTSHSPEGELTFYNPPTATVVLERSYDGSSWTQIGTQSFSGSVSYFRGWGWAEPGEYIAQCGGSFTVTDNSTSMSNFYYRLRITARSVSIILPGTTDQRLTVVSTEE